MTDTDRENANSADALDKDNATIQREQDEAGIAGEPQPTEMDDSAAVTAPTATAADEAREESAAHPS